MGESSDISPPTESGQGCPSYRTESREGGPSYRTELREGGPSYRTESREGGPSYRTESREGGPSYRTESREGGPSYRTESREGGPSYRTELREGGPSYRTELREGGLSYRTESREGGPSYRTELREGGPSYRTELREGGLSYRTELRQGGLSHGLRCLSYCLLIWLVVAHVPYALSAPIEELGTETRFWTLEIPLSLAPTLAREPTICARGEEIFVAWSDDRLGQWEIFFRYSGDGGITWQPEERVTTTNTDSVEPAIACDHQRVHIVWLERQWSGQLVGGVQAESVRHPQIRYTAWDGTVWSLPQTLSLKAGVVRRPRVAATQTSPDGSVYVVWERLAGGQEGSLTTAIITRSDEDGQTWARPRPITRGDWETAEPDVAGGIHSAFVTWRDGRKATSQIYVKRWSETTVSGDFLLAADGNCRRPSIAVQESRVFVVWECLLGDIAPADILVATSADRGETWMPAQAISANTTESIAPQLVVRQNDAWIFWQNGTAAGNWELHTAQHQSHDTWTQGTQFTESNSSNSISPAVVGQVVTLKGVEEQLHLVWVEQSSANRSTILYSRRDTLPPIPPNQPFHIDPDAPAGFDNDLALTFSWHLSSQGRGQGSGGTEVKHQYHVFLSIDGGAYTELASTAKDIFTFSGENNKQYRLKLKASDLVGNLSPFSEPSAPVFVDSNAPTVEIHLPLPDTVVTQPVPIIATCQDTNLVECRLQFGATIAPSEWTPLGAPIRIPFERERLTVWDTSNLDGVYTLALIAFDTVGNRSVTEIPVFIDGTPPLSLEGGEGVRLIDENLAVSFRTPAWGPDGQKIAFSSNEGGAVDIWMLDIGKNRRVRLTRDVAIDLHPAWHPNADLLTFQSQRYGGADGQFDGLPTGWEIWTVRSDGSPPQPLITLDRNLDFNLADGQTEGTFASANFETPAWSPKGRQLAFAADLDGDLEIWVMRNVNDVLSGAAPDLFQLTQNSAQDRYPTWSPDGTHLAFQSDRTGNWDIWQIRIDASDEKQVYRSFANETRPKWSPDGKRILFLSDQVGDARTAFALGLQDHDLTEISPLGVPIEHVDWSPDGSALVYQQGELLHTMALNFPAPDIEAKITRPFQASHVQDKVNVFGLARGLQFREYRLEYAPTSNPRFLGRGKETVGSGRWQRIGGNSTAQVSREGFLGQWDTRRLHGVFVLRLIAVSENGEEISDSITVSVYNERPRLEIFEPPDGLLTTEGLLTVRGRTEPQVDISVNDIPIVVDNEGNFRTQLLLREGTNEIAIEAVSATGLQADGLQTSVRRTVLRDTRAPEITIDSPPDFTISEVPYITVSGKVDDVTAQFSINDINIPLRPNGDFERTLRLKTDLSDATEESTNLIRVKAVDGLGRTTEAERRVIYASGKQVDSPFVQKDTNPPAITEVMPPDGATQIYSELAHSDGKITAILVDDVAIEPLTIRFSFDGADFVFDGTEEAASFDGQTFDFQPDTGQFTYTPSTIGADGRLIDGRHTFKLAVQDTSGNAAEPIAFAFFVDTQPFDIAISAERSGNVLKVILATNKLLGSIPLVEVLPSGASLGYPLNLNPSSDNGVAQGTPATGGHSQIPVFRYVGEFPFSLSQSGFTLSATVRGPGGVEVPVVGYFTDENRFPDVALVPFPQIVRGQTSLLTLTHLFIDGGPAIMFLQQSTATGLRATLRSQGGLVQDLILAQRQNATDRGLTILQPVYVVEANVGEQEMPFRIGLPPPALLRDSRGNQQSRGKFDQTALFQWDKQLQQWLPLDAHVNGSGLMEAVADRLGHYALLVEDTPPTIQSFFEDGSEVPLNRFLIEVEILDGGSGIDSVLLKIDGQRAEFVWERAPTLGSGEQTDTARLIYLPSNLDSGKHTFEVTATDRAGNVAQYRQTFSTRDIFAFADEIVAYPNPTSSEVNINFKLTMSADVTLGIYNVGGELLYTDELQNVVGQQSATRNEGFIWRCKNQAGKSVASGVYVYILEAEREGEVVRQTGKVAVVR